MKVLLINGSPHEKGCTYTALREMADVLEAGGLETEIFWIGSEPQGSCIGCGGCGREGHCVFGGTVVTAAAKAREADAFVFGSPVHYASMTGNLTGFMDRLSWSAGKYLQHKPAAVVASARRAGTTATLDQLIKYPQFFNMPIVTGNYWPMVHGNTPDEVRQDKEGLQILRNIARNMVWLLNCLQAGKAAGISAPSNEPKEKTNFIR